MIQKKYILAERDQSVVNRYILRKGGTLEWREVQKSLVEQCIGMIGKPLPEIRDDDILKVRDMIIGSKYRPNYQRQLIKALRNFFLWYQTHSDNKFLDIEGIKLPRGQWKTKNPSDMLTPQDIEAILHACKNPRDRCFIAMLWDGSNRPIELLNLSWKDLKADNYGYHFTTSAKTGKERHIRLTISIPYIEEWKRNYPGEPAGDAPVFVTVHKVGGGYERWNRGAAQAMIKELRKDISLKRMKNKMKLSIFRPSRITHDVKSGYDMPYIMKKNWGTLKTAMIDLYTNVDADYVDQIALRHAGMVRVDKLKEEPYKLKVPECPVCHTLNPIGSLFCARCSEPITDETRTTRDQIRQVVRQNPEKILEELQRLYSEKKIT
jgi:integrase/recombinase XerD